MNKEAKMFYLIGLGLDIRSMSYEAIEKCVKAKKVYLENYTVDFPYEIEKLEDTIEKKISPLTRAMVESEDFVDEAKEEDIVLLVYGSPLIATTHISLVLKCKKEKIPHRVLHNASIFDAISETGLQIYKFGKTASMPTWKDKHKPDSFVKIIQDNQKIKAHSLVLVDIGLSFPDALKQLEEACEDKVTLDQIVVCSAMGTEGSKVYYSDTDKLFGAEAFPPFCIIIPSKLHFLEEEALSTLKEQGI